MQIHVVQRNDSLYNIANTYGTTVEALVEANEIETPNQLVIGQTLVVPIIGQFYFLQPGDSLYEVSRKFNIPLEQLAAVNRIPPQNILPVGYRIYIPPAPKTTIRSLAYIEPRGDTVSPQLINTARKSVPLLTHLMLFSYQVNRDGSLSPPASDNLKQIAEAQGASITLVVTNLENFAFSAELGHIILTVQAVQDRLIDHVVNTAINEGYTGIHFDFEFLRPEDREAYVRFLQRVKARLENTDILLSAALAPKTSKTQGGELHEAHDYEQIGAVVDYVLLMTYEWGHSGGPPMAISPIKEVRKVVDYALSVMPKEKIVLGQNLYGYEWTIPAAPGEMARAISPQEAIRIARLNNARIEYDDDAQAPFFIYYDNEQKRHEVWFEDARSIQAKFNLIKEKGIRGIGYWKLGISFPQNWLLLQDQFNIAKNE